jgi:hypothetical protein
MPREDDQTLETGKYVLVKFCSGSRRTQIYRYVCNILEVRDMELKVMGFKAWAERIFLKRLKMMCQ